MVGQWVVAARRQEEEGVKKRYRVSWASKTLNPGLNPFGKTLPSTLGIRSLPPKMFRASSHRLVFHLFLFLITCLPFHYLLLKPK
jgi:hypothetical protein